MLSFRIAGRIQERRVKVGDQVKEGDILATLDTAPYQSDFDTPRSPPMGIAYPLHPAEPGGEQRRSTDELSPLGAFFMDDTKPWYLSRGVIGSAVLSCTSKAAPAAFTLLSWGHSPLPLRPPRYAEIAT